MALTETVARKRGTEARQLLTVGIRIDMVRGTAGDCRADTRQLSDFHSLLGSANVKV